MILSLYHSLMTQEGHFRKRQSVQRDTIHLLNKLVRKKGRKEKKNAFLVPSVSRVQIGFMLLTKKTASESYNLFDTLGQMFCNFRNLYWLSICCSETRFVNPNAWDVWLCTAWKRGHKDMIYSNNVICCISQGKGAENNNNSLIFGRLELIEIKRAHSLRAGGKEKISDTKRRPPPPRFCAK